MEEVQTSTPFQDVWRAHAASRRLSRWDRGNPHRRTSGQTPCNRSRGLIILLPPQMYEVALWQGYSLHLFQFSPLKITEVADVDHFMASFFPEGLDADQDTFTLKVPHGYTDFVQDGFCSMSALLRFHGGVCTFRSGRCWDALSACWSGRNGAAASARRDSATCSRCWTFWGSWCRFYSNTSTSAGMFITVNT